MRKSRYLITALVGITVAASLAGCTEGGATTSEPTTSTPDASPRTPSGELNVGSAKVDITPTDDELIERYTGVEDPLFARAIAIQNADETVALVTVDLGGISTELWSAVTTKLEDEYDIDSNHLMLSATHTHSAQSDRAPDVYADLIVQSVGEALDVAVPARMGTGNGESYLNVNRSIIDPETGTWWEGPNVDGVSDKTVRVVAFETTEGEPIAVYYNYAMHAVTTGMLDKISADYPGAASAYIEKSLGGDSVAVFSNGAAGDQNPRYFDQTYQLRELRIQDYAERGEDISNAMPPGGEGLDREDPEVSMLLAQQVEMSNSMGQMLGEEVLDTVRAIDTWKSDASIGAATSTATCPGRDRTDEGRAGQAGTYKDGEDVNLRLGVINIGDLYLGAVDGEVFNAIGQRLLDESPHKETILTTLTNGRANSGYIYSDEAAAQFTFEVISSRLKPGCAEGQIVNGILELIDTV